MKDRRKQKIIVYMRSLAILLAIATTAVFFQNCGSGPDSAMVVTSSSSINVPANSTSCPVSSNNEPTITSISQPSISFRQGMGRDAGSEAAKSVSIQVDSGDSISGVVDIACNARDNNGKLNITCNDPTPMKSGTINIGVNSADGAECGSGTVTVEIRVRDAILNAQNAPITACNSLNKTSAIRTLTIQVINACLPTQRVDPSVPTANGQLGSSVAVDNDFAVAVSPLDDERGEDAGAAFVYRRSGTTWQLLQKLMPSNLVAGDNLYAAAISGNVIVLGAPFSNARLGRAWVYNWNGTTWVESKVLEPATNDGRYFGQAVATNGTSVAIGTPGNNNDTGMVSVFSGAGWNSLTRLMPSGSNTAKSQFGASLSYSGSRLAIGAPFLNSFTPRTEAVYLFDNNTLVKKIENAEGANHRFGASVALDGTNLAIGAPYHMSERGTVFLYQNINAAPVTGTAAVSLAQATRQYVHSDVNNTGKDHLGMSVALKGTRLLIGAPDKAEGSPKFGAVYLFSTADNRQLFKIRSYMADRSNDSFGYSIGVTADGWLLSGAINDENLLDVSNSGSLYFVKLP